MNELDQFVKHKLKVKHYIRYADDFIILSEDKNYLNEQVPIIRNFLQDKLSLALHPDKVFIGILYSGVDFLGWVNFSDHRILRNTTKNRILKKISDVYNPKTLASYFGLLSHGNTSKIKNRIIRLYIRKHK